MFIIYNLDCVKYFLPMSGDCWIIATYGGSDYPVETTQYLEKVISDGNYNETDFYVYQGIGTNDPIWAQTNNQIQEMMKTNTFYGEKFALCDYSGRQARFTSVCVKDIFITACRNSLTQIQNHALSR